MSSRSDLLVVTPAPASAVLACAGRGVWMRRALILQAAGNQSCALVHRRDGVLAVAMFQERRGRRVHMALSIGRAAIPHMRALVRHAQLTLRAMTETGLTVGATVAADNPQGQRMAALAGFRRANRTHWIWRGQ